jgi:di/tricarboxylate transporter
MRIRKRVIFFVCLTSLILLFGQARSVGEAEVASSLNGSGGQESKSGTGVIPSRGPRYISVRLKVPLQTLVAGETGSFEIEAYLNAPKSVHGNPLAWNQNAAGPVTIWISSPPDSGIAFIDRVRPDRPYHHLLVKYNLPQENESQPIAAKIEYTLNPATKAGKHAFWLDIAAELITAQGQEIHDMGVVTLPFTVDTHLRTKLLMLLVVAAAVFLFIVEWVRVDVVGILMMVLLPELGLLNAQDAFRGLSSNAVVAIIGVMIISYGLNRAGLVSRIIQPVLGFIGKSASRLVVIFSALIAAISSVMQNTGAAVLFLPAIRLAASHRLKTPVSRVLMPIGMAAILGGTLTMIGTSPLILLNDILPQGMPKFGFLELTPIGLALVIGGIAYLSTGGMRLLAGSSSGRSDVTAGSTDAVENTILSSYPLINGPYEIFVPEDCRAEKDPLEVVSIRRRFLVNIVALAKDNRTYDVAPLPNTVIRAGFALCAYGPEKAVREFVRDYGLVLRQEPLLFKNTMFNPAIAGVVEVVVSPRSSLTGKTIKEIRFRQTFGLNPLAVHQSGRTYYRELADLPLQAGDMVLVHGTWEQFHALQELHQNFIVISPFEEEFHKPEKATRAFVCFSIALILMLFSSFYFQKFSYNPLPLSVCLMAGALGMILSKVMTISEAYRAVDWRTVFLLGGLIPLGMAVDQTGTAQWIAKGIIIGLGNFMSPLLLLIILACLSCAFTMVISNVGACALLVPLGVSIAHQIGIDARVAVIVIGLGVSNSFILPTHQVNALYMGPGEYRSSDYVKIGGLLSLIYIVILVAMTYLFYL